MLKFKVFIRNSLQFKNYPVLLGILFTLCCSSYIAYRTSIQYSGSLSYPPIYGNSDQFDYMRLGYNFMKNTTIGYSYSKDYQKPYLEFKQQHGDSLPKVESTQLSRVFSTTSSEVKPYTYRPWLFPILLGISFKVFGYNFRVSRILGIVIFTTLSLSIIILGGVLGSVWIGIFAANLVTLTPNLTKYCAFVVTESLGALLTTLTIALLCFISKKKRFEPIWLLAAGCLFGLLVWSRSIFLATFPAILLAIWWYLPQKNLKYCINLIFFPVGFALFVLPWFAYNLAATQEISLISGTQGPQGFVMGFDPRYLDSRTNKYTLRSTLIREYVERTGKPRPKNQKEAALYYKEIFKQQLQAESFPSLLPQYFKKKFLECLESVSQLHIFIRIGYLLGLITMISKGIILFPLAFHLSILALGCMYTPDHGRFLVPLYPVVCVFSGFGIIELAARLRRVGHYIYTQIMISQAEKDLQKVAKK